MPKVFSFTSTSPQATERLAMQFAQKLPPNCLVFLSGTLGAGKTQFAKGVARGLGITNETVSPTFTLSIPYAGRLPLLHVDAYRIRDLDEVAELGIDEWLETGGVVLVEWAEKIELALRPPDLEVQIQPLDETVRQLTFRVGESAATALSAFLQSECEASPER